MPLRCNIRHAVIRITSKRDRQFSERAVPGTSTYPFTISSAPLKWLTSTSQGYFKIVHAWESGTLFSFMFVLVFV